MKRISDLLVATRQKAKHAQEVGKDMAAMEYTSYADAIEELQAKLDAVIKEVKENPSGASRELQDLLNSFGDKK